MTSPIAQTNQKLEKKHILSFLDDILEVYIKEKRSGNMQLGINFCEGGIIDVDIIQESRMKKSHILEKFALQSKKCIVYNP